MNAWLPRSRMWERWARDRTGLAFGAGPPALALAHPAMSALPNLRFTRRAMGVRDVDAVQAVEARAYSFPWSRGNFVDSLTAGYVADVLHVLDGQNVILAGYFVAMLGPDELHLLNITVAPEWQGRGLGWSLLQVVQALGVARGLGCVFLEVRASNHHACALYRRFGFAKVGVRRDYYPAAVGREDAIVMRLELIASKGN